MKQHDHLSFWLLYFPLVLKEKNGRGKERQKESVTLPKEVCNDDDIGEDVREREGERITISRMYKFQTRKKDENREKARKSERGMGVGG